MSVSARVEHLIGVDRIWRGAASARDDQHDVERVHALRCICSPIGSDRSIDLGNS